MRLSVVAFTAAGADLAVRAARALEKNGHTLLDIRVIKSGAVQPFGMDAYSI